jgi:hypothetical protein
MQSLSYLRGRRLWVVRNFLIWGTADESRLFYLGVEDIDSTSRIMFGVNGTGGSIQDVQFLNLIDFKGNHLPPVIKSPKVIIRFRSPYSAYLIGEESNSGFRIARDNNAPGPVSVDFFIFEMGA